MSQKKTQWDILEFANQANKLIESNFKILLGLFVAAVVVGSVWTYTESVARQNERNAFDELYKITKIYNKKKADFEEAKAAKTEKKDPKAPAPKKPKKDLVEATGDMNIDYLGVIQPLEKFIDSHKGSNASGEAALILSEIYEKHDKAEKGVNAIARALAPWKDKNVLYFVMQMRSGDLLASQNNCEKAVEFWEVVGNSESFMARQAQLKSGVCLQKVGKIEEAKKWFLKVQEKDPNSSEAFSAKRYIRFLEFKTKTGEGATDDKALTKKTKSDTPS